VQKAWVLKSSGHSALDKAAMKSIPRWVFQPARNNGKAVMGTVQFPVVFRLK
jgi:TonB family protein